MSGMTDKPQTQSGIFNSGLYVLVMRLRAADSIEVGALGRFQFPAGWYLYTGSASRNLHQRVERHWSLQKKVRWHVDYLSTAPDLEPVGAVLVPQDPKLTECQLNRAVENLVAGSVLAPGFGASDCQAGCPAHLWFSLTPVSLLAVAKVHRRAALLLPGAGIWEPGPIDLDIDLEIPPQGGPPC